MESDASNALKEAAKAAWADLVAIDTRRMKRAAGVASVAIASFKDFHGNKQRLVSNPNIKFSKEIMKRMTEEEQFQTASHELAHIIDFYFRNKSGHDSVWKRIHAHMGGDGKRFHDVDVSDLRKKVLRVVLESKYDGSQKIVTRKHFEKLVAIGYVGDGHRYSLEGFFWIRNNKLIRALTNSELVNKGLVEWAVRCGW